MKRMPWPTPPQASFGTYVLAGKQIHSQLRRVHDAQSALPRRIAPPASPDFLSCFRTWKGENEEVIFKCEPAVETLRPFSPSDYVGWEMSVPDQYRADFIIKELKQFRSQG